MSKGYYFDKKSKTFIIDKQVNGIRLYERTGLGLKDENSVKQIVAEKTVEIRKAQDKSQRPVVTFRECAYEYLKRNKSSKQIRHFAWQIQALDPFIGHVNAASIHQEHFAVKRIVADIESRGLKTRSIQSALEAIQRVLNAATQWRYDWCDLTWLESAPKFKMPKRKDAVPHAILTWDEQPVFLEHCAQHVKDEVLVYVNTGLRDFELNSLRWEDELQLPNGLMGFIAKNKSDSQGNERTKLIVCNDIVREIIESVDSDTLCPSSSALASSLTPASLSREPKVWRKP